MRLSTPVRERAGPLQGLAFRALPLAIALIGSGAHAAETVYLGEDTTLDSSLTLSYTASARTSRPSGEYLNDLNSDDATRNFKRGALVNNRASALGELRLKHDNVGAMLRGNIFYDAVYRSSNDNDSPTTVNKIGPANEFVAKTRERSGQDAQLLDAFVYGNWVVGNDQYLSLKLGRHVVAWGESLFWPNISQGQLPVDATKFNVPGTEAKESYLPVGQLSASLTLTDALSLTGYYQYKWEETRLNPVGDFFGSDFFGPGAEFMRLAPGVISSLPDNSFRVANFAGEIKPRDSGQWGLGLRYQLSDAVEVGLFHYRYHDRVGALLFDFTGTTSYSSFSRFGSEASPASTPYFKLGYFDDIKLTGISLSSKIGDSVQVGGDLSYRDGAPVYLDNGAPARGSYLQGNANAIYILGPSKLAHQTTLMGEVVHQRITGVDELTVSGGLPGQNGTFSNYEYDGQTRGSTLVGLGAIFDYPSIFSGWDLSMRAIWTQNIQGSAYSGMGRDEKRLTLGADFKYLGNLSLGLTWVNYLGSPSLAQQRMMADRDYVSFNAKYTF
ncbi:MAG TPA: DUF1302 family protein [Thauera sp.]|uniref:DUF1302 domain-containing protein n=1 Tax=Thauera sp. TaxID=1905334 RepID=UPI002D03EC00|nr:DUF1302 family protein [Thauera sp.]HRP24067.1 DUF1302 family protein [Thauera sp.]HRP66483.1 DUF1302 family protein [Thauera sp.]